MVEHFSTNWEIIAKKKFALSDILITLGVNRKNATIHIEANEIMLIVQTQRKAGQIKVFSELSLNWDKYISIMGDNLIFSHLQNFYSDIPLLINAILAYAKNSAQPVWFNASIKADDFELTHENSVQVDKQFLLNTLFAKHGGSYFTAEGYIPYKTIPEHVANAVICTEDPNFGIHKGIDLYGIDLALLANFNSMKFERGASTITMQLVRNLFLNHDKNILRKVEECVIALLIENYFKIEKEDILELYLNLIEFAPNVYGLHHASLLYFGKPYSELSLTESLVLTYIIPRPKHFYEALLLKTEQLQKNLHLHIQRYARIMLRKGLIMYSDYNSISSTIVFSSQFGVIML